MLDLAHRSAGGSDSWVTWKKAFPSCLDREEAEAAILARPALEPKAWSARELATCEAAVGRGADALDRLAKSDPCDRTRPAYPRALALEGAGRTEEACAAYAAVLDRYGKGTSVPRTAKLARERSAALHCKATSVGANR